MSVARTCWCQHPSAHRTISYEPCDAQGIDARTYHWHYDLRDQNGLFAHECERQELRILLDRSSLLRHEDLLDLAHVDHDDLCELRVRQQRRKERSVFACCVFTGSVRCIESVKHER